MCGDVLLDEFDREDLLLEAFMPAGSNLLCDCEPRVDVIFWTGGLHLAAQFPCLELQI